MNKNIIASELGIEDSKEIQETKEQSIISLDDFSNRLIENRMNDYIIARDNILNLLEEVKEVISNTVLEIKSSSSASMVGVFSNLAKIYTDINKDLLNISESKHIESKEQQNNKPQQNNVVFIGTSDSLIDNIKNNN